MITPRLLRDSRGGDREAIAGAGCERREIQVELDVEVTSQDISNMVAMKQTATELMDMAKQKYVNLRVGEARHWDTNTLKAGAVLTYTIADNALEGINDEPRRHFLNYLQLFEMHATLRDEYGLETLSTPLLYLPVNRSSGPFQSKVSLANFNEFELKRQYDGASSRNAAQIAALAVGRLAQTYRLLLEKDKGGAQDAFRADPDIQELTTTLRDLGYEWRLDTVNALKNEYDLRLMKHGASFLVSAASSGERELLTYLFAIYALKARNALVIVDEAELHLHPKWQASVLEMFSHLAQTTGNQFLLSTHSPSFVSPESIHYVSRVFSAAQNSEIVRLNTAALPQARHLLSIVNSQNNERLFFADEVVLVEGVSDRIFFERLLDHFGRTAKSRIIEVLSVGGKGFFAPYVALLSACQIKHSMIADLDYVKQVGTDDLKILFREDARKILRDVLKNPKSQDGDAVVATIDAAIDSGNWLPARELWQQIKSTRVALRQDLSAAEESRSTSFSWRRGLKVYISSRLARWRPTCRSVTRARTLRSSSTWSTARISGRCCHRRARRSSKILPELSSA